MNSNSENQNFYKLPRIPSTTNPKTSESYNYFKYAKNQMQMGDLNPNYKNPPSYHPYQIPSQTDLDPTPFNKLFQRENMIYNRINNDTNKSISYSLPQLQSFNNNKIKEIREGEIVNFPDESYIPLSKFENIKELFNQKKQKDLRTIRFQNRPRWKLIRYLIYMMRLFYTFRKLTKHSIYLKKNQMINIQSIKGNLMELRKIILPALKNIKKFTGELFGNLLVYDTNNEKRKKYCTFVVRSFIQQLFSDLSSAFTYYEEIPFTLRKIVKYFISDGYQIPFGYLTTFEFNRLEFNSDSTLSHMNNERRAMLVCFILFYRILILDIFRRHYHYFPTLNLLIENIRKKKLKKEENEYLEMKKIEKLERDIRNEKRIKNNPKSIILKKINPSPPPPKPNNDNENDSPNKSKTQDLAKSVIQRETITNYNYSINRNRRNRNNNNYDDEDDYESNYSDYDERNKKSKRNKNYDDDDYDDYKKSRKKKKKKKNKNKNKNNYDEDSNNSNLYDDDYDDDYPKRKKKSISKKKNKRKNTSFSDDDYEDYKSNFSKRNKNKLNYNDDYNDYNDIDNYNTYNKINNINPNDTNYYPYSYNEYHNNNIDPRYKIKQNNKNDISNKIGNEIWGDDLNDDDSNFPKGKYEKDLFEKNEIEKSRLKVLKNEDDDFENGNDIDTKRIKAIITHNFCFIINILHYILSSSLQENVPRYGEFYKERYLYKLLVFKKIKQPYKMKNDDIEIIDNIILDNSKTKDFIEDNKRWLQMYKHVAFQLCNDFSRKCFINN